MDGSNCITKLYLRKQRTAGFGRQAIICQPLLLSLCLTKCVVPPTAGSASPGACQKCRHSGPPSSAQSAFVGRGPPNGFSQAPPARSSSLRSPTSHPCFLPGAPGTRDFGGLSDGNDLIKDLFGSQEEYKISQYSPRITEKHFVHSNGAIENKAAANPSRTA